MILLTTALGLGAAACSGGESSDSSSSTPNNRSVAPVPNPPLSGLKGGGSSNASTTPTTSAQQSAPTHALTVTNQSISAIPGLLSLVGATINVPVAELQTTTVPGSMLDVWIASQYNEDPGTDNTVGITVVPISSLPGGSNPFPGWLSQAKSGSDPNLFRMAGEVNGNQAVWSSNNNLVTEFDGYLLEVQVINHDADGNELPSNIDNAVQIATLFENNATS